MTLVSKQTFRSEGKNLSDNDDMVRIVLDMTISESYKFNPNNDTSFKTLEILGIWNEYFKIGLSIYYNPNKEAVYNEDIQKCQDIYSYASNFANGCIGEYVFAHNNIRELIKDA